MRHRFFLDRALVFALIRERQGLPIYLHTVIRRSRNDPPHQSTFRRQRGCEHALDEGETLFHCLDIRSQRIGSAILPEGAQQPYAEV